MWKTHGVTNGSVGVSTPFAFMWKRYVFIILTDGWVDETSIYDWSPLIRHQTRSKILAWKSLTGTIFQNILLSLRGNFQGLGELRWNCSQLKCKGIGPLTWFLLQTVVPCQQGQSRWSRQGKVGVHVATMFWCKLFVISFSSSGHCILHSKYLSIFNDRPIDACFWLLWKNALRVLHYCY